MVSVLFLILGYLIWNGGKSLNWNFFTQLPKPVGETGGGMANAIVGSLKLLLARRRDGLARRIDGGRVPGGVRRQDVLVRGSLHHGLAQRRPVDRDRNFRLLARGAPGEAFLHSGRRLGPRHHGDSYHRAQHRRVSARRFPNSLREGAMALGASKWRTIATVVLPAASGGILTGMLLALARVAGETAPLLFTAFSNRFWSPGWGQPIASLPVMIYTYAIAPYDDWHRQAWAAGLVLLGLVLLANLGCRLVLNRGGAVRSVLRWLLQHKVRIRQLRGSHRRSA